jgi:hypothetical protein
MFLYEPLSSSSLSALDFDDPWFRISSNNFWFCSIDFAMHSPKRLKAPKSKFVTWMGWFREVSEEATELRSWEVFWVLGVSSGLLWDDLECLVVWVLFSKL